MGLLRSEAMKYGMLVLPVQDARTYLENIGNKTSVQFEDMNSHEMRRPYNKHVQRINEMERMLRFMFEEISKMDGCTVKKNKIDEFLASDDSYTLDGVESELQQLYRQFVNFKENNALLVNERNQAAEELMVMEAAQNMLSGSTSTSDTLNRPLLGDDSLGRLGYLAGTVLKVDEGRFARALWRASRGNTFAQFSPVKEKLIDAKTGLEAEKSVFVIYFQGAAGSMQQKVMKVCQAFGVNMYAWPTNAGAAAKRCAMLQSQLQEKEKALEAFANFMRTESADMLSPSSGNLDGNSKIEDWRLFCMKEKSLYTILNMCAGDIVLRVNVWYPSADEDKIHNVLKQANKGSQLGAFLKPDKGVKKSVPPTYVRVNDFTEGWQDVINTYGIPAYQEANPALFTVVTFPFIFGMMYGDVGHGTLLMLAGLWLVFNAEKFKYTVPALFSARYMVLELGIFAVFAGFMYNDFFSLGLQIFPSGYDDPNGDGNLVPNYDVTNSGGPGPYPFGLDWAWMNTSNELLYVNSMKMKLSVLFGVLQMTVGALLRWSNVIYQKNMTDFIFECLPMMTFMLCFFGWMDVMILYKWTHPIEGAPSIINSLICMAMGQEDNSPLWDGSVPLSKTLMSYTLLSVPLMLFPKPFVLLYQHNKRTKEAASGHGKLVDEESAGGHGHGHGEEFEFGEIFIHQIIETIEFVLGTVSHTASYLRIWALSLAHQQLSLVFFQKTLQMGLNMSFPMNGIALYFLMGAWFGVTVGVLMGMDVLECFLHTLRLHWVEFQSKFYKAEGEPFQPYDIKKLVTPTGDE